MRHGRVAALLLAAFVLPACQPTEPLPAPSPSPVVEPAGPGTLRWALGADPTSLDPARIVRDDDALLVDALFDSLTRLGPDLEAESALATSWTSTPDARSFTFTLDPAAQWHDGTRVVADDVVRGLQRIADGEREPASVHAGLLRNVVGFAAAQVGQPLRGVVAVDDATVRIDLSDPLPELPRILAHPALAPAPPQALEDPITFGEAPVGNGPFRLAEAWAHNQFLRLAPSATHPSPENVEEVVFRIYGSDEDRSIRHADLLAGQIQVSQLPAGRRDEVTAPGSDLTLLDGLTDTVSMLLFDTRQPPLDDPRFRRGVSLLIDRDALAARTDGARAAASSLVPPVLPGATGNPCVWCRHDPDVAASLIETVLAERERDLVGPPAPLVLQTSTDPVHSTLADQLSAALRGVGLQVRVVREDTASYLDVAAEEQPAVIRLGWAPDEATLRPWTEELFGPGTIGARLTGWQPGSLLDLLGTAAGSADSDTRERAWRQVERLALDAAVVAPVLHYRDDLLVAESVEGLVRDPFGNVDLTNVRVASP